ncbi:MAG: magnesium/cobalt transporter CorA [Saccharofermentanales bacterium]
MAAKIITKRPFKKEKAKKQGINPGDTVKKDIAIEIFDYGVEKFNEYQFAGDEIGEYEKLPPAGAGMVRWINIDGTVDLPVIEQICKPYNIHTLVMNNILNTEHRPRIEDYDDYMYLIAKMAYFDGPELVNEQLSIILGKGFILSFGERKGDVFNDIRDKIRKNWAHIRKNGADYLAYTMLDAIIDGYFVVLEGIGDQIDDVEEEFLTSPTKEGLTRMRLLKRDLLYLHKSIWPLREVITNMERNEKDLIIDSTRIYIRDIYDHIIQALDTTEIFRELLAGLMDIYLSSVSNKLNEIMKVLTIISTIFIPITFLVGLYGMNFKYMPELNWEWGYGSVIAVIITVVISMLLFFKHKKWI